MENTSATKVKKSDFITLSYSDNVNPQFIENLLIDNTNLKLIKKEADIKLDYDAGLFIISSEKNRYYAKDDYINLKNIINLISKVNNQKSLFKERKINDLILKKVDNKKYNEWNTLKKELKVISSKSTTLFTFPEFFLHSKFFKNYLSVMVFIHEKGSKTVDCYIYEHNLGKKATTYTIDTFNKLFSTIKKSKSKSFSLTTSQNLNLDFAGSFLGKEYNFTTNNAILLLSRNDFLTPSLEEINNFDMFCDYLKPVIGELISREKNFLKFKDIFHSIEMFPLPLEILSKNGELLFANNNSHSDTKSELIEQIKSEEFDINIYSTFEIEQSTSDVFHFQRISLLGELLNTLKHELSNPLFGMYLTATLLTDSVDGDNLEMVGEIQNAIKRSQDIIENISTLYKADSTYEDFDIVNVINDIFLISKSETKSVLKTINTNNITDSDRILHTNPTWVSQIIFNLIINSSQAMKSSNIVSPEIVITLNKDEQFMYIEISDNGPGIKNVNPDEVFKPFFTTKKNGTGLGLNISKNLLSKLGGDIEYLSKAEKSGANFLIKLPL